MLVRSPQAVGCGSLGNLIAEKIRETEAQRRKVPQWVGERLAKELGGPQCTEGMWK